MPENSDVNERVARLEERTSHHEDALKSLRDDIKALVRRLNQLLYTLLAALLSGVVSLGVWIIKTVK